MLPGKYNFLVLLKVAAAVRESGTSWIFLVWTWPKAMNSQADIPLDEKCLHALLCWIDKVGQNGSPNVQAAGQEAEDIPFQKKSAFFVCNQVMQT